MVNILISNKDVSFANNLENMLANDKNYVFKITTTEADTTTSANIKPFLFNFILSPIYY